MKYYYYIGLYTILLSSLAFVSVAQTADVENDYSNEIGFNTTFLLNGVFKSTSTPFSLMYKKYKDNNNPLRLGIRMSIGLSIIDTPPSHYSNASSFYFAAVIGKEFQKEISQRWRWYFGGDIIPAYKHDYYKYNPLGTDYVHSTKINGVSIGISPFLGLRFNLNKRLYLSTEINLRPTYSYAWINEESGIGNDTTTLDRVIGEFNFSINPGYELFLYYRF